MSGKIIAFATPEDVRAEWLAKRRAELWPLVPGKWAIVKTADMEPPELVEPVEILSAPYEPMPGWRVLRVRPMLPAATADVLVRESECEGCDYPIALRVVELAAASGCKSWIGRGLTSAERTGAPAW